MDGTRLLLKMSAWLNGTRLITVRVVEWLLLKSALFTGQPDALVRT